MGWNYLSIPKLQRCNRWSLGMDKQFHPTVYNGCNYLSLGPWKCLHKSWQHSQVWQRSFWCNFLGSLLVAPRVTNRQYIFFECSSLYMKYYIHCVNLLKTKFPTVAAVFQQNLYCILYKRKKWWLKGCQAPATGTEHSALHHVIYWPL